MRRTDRQIVSPDRLREILMACEVMHLGLCVGNSPYVVPLNFGFEEAEGKYIFYFHGALEGKKLDLIRQNPNVFLCFDTDHALMAGEAPEHYSYHYASVMGEGFAEILTEEADKVLGLERIFHHYAPDMPFSVPEKMLEATAVIRITVPEITGKAH